MAAGILRLLFNGMDDVFAGTYPRARSLGPAIVWNEYTGIWIYLTAPILGAVSGAWAYNAVRYTDKPLQEINKSASFLKGSCNSG
ncbi:hypothetical protein V6N11_038035 [Hibiscus sabdariffa]|uniref:Uncharacterized protein n=1 Tax=Hibiscus sabdariffa TaxID=183260 RepID=A0ABR1ZL83_9ROSI